MGKKEKPKLRCGCSAWVRRAQAGAAASLQAHAGRWKQGSPRASTVPPGRQVPQLGVWVFYTVPAGAPGVLPRWVCGQGPTCAHMCIPIPLHTCAC